MIWHDVDRTKQPAVAPTPERGCALQKSQPHDAGATFTPFCRSIGAPEITSSTSAHPNDFAIVTCWPRTRDRTQSARELPSRVESTVPPFRASAPEEHCTASTEKTCWRPAIPALQASLLAGSRRTEHAFPGGEDIVPPAVV